MSMDDSEAAGRLGGYADMILGIDDTVNPVGVECWMRLQYGTLDHLPRETFAAEAAMAKVGEELQPGSLREIAGTYGSAERYDIAQGIIDARAKARDEAAAGDPLVADFIAGGGRPSASFSSLDIGWDPRAHDFPVSVLMSAEESGAQLSVVYDDGRGPDRRQRVVTGTAQEVAERLGQQGYAVELQPPGRGPASFSLPPGEEGEAARGPAVKIEQAGGGRISVVSPYHKNFPGRAKELGGKWYAQEKAWVFDAREEPQVRDLCREVYGTDGPGTEVADVRARFTSEASAARDGVYLLGREVARAWGRDSGAKLGTGVILESGRIASGGSSANWRTEVREDTVLLLHDVPKSLVDAHDDSGVVLSVGGREIEARGPGDRLGARDRLAAERERLNAEHAASVAAIDAEIAALGGFGQDTAADEKLPAADGETRYARVKDPANPSLGSEAIGTLASEAAACAAWGANYAAVHVRPGRTVDLGAAEWPDDAAAAVREFYEAEQIANYGPPEFEGFARDLRAGHATANAGRTFPLEEDLAAALAPLGYETVRIPDRDRGEVLAAGKPENVELAAAPGKRDGEAMKAAAEPRADGGTPPDRGGRMSRGRPAGDIIEREAREAGEEVDRELGRAREALAAAGVPCRDVVVEMAPHRNPPAERFIALAHGTGAGERVVAGGGETPRAAAVSVREHASAVAYSLGLGAGEGTRYAQPRTGPRPEQERPEQEAAVPAGTAADQPLRVWIGAIRVGENKPEEIDRFLLRRDADGNYVPEEMAPEEMAPELTKRQVAYIANVHARERRPIPDLLTEAGQSEAWKFVREQAAARKSREEPPQPRVAPQPQTSPQPRPGPRLEQAAEAAGKPALTAEALEAKAEELRKGYREDVRSVEMHQVILDRARARKVWPESEEAVAKAGTRQAARRKEAAALGIELEPRRETLRRPAVGGDGGEERRRELPKLQRADAVDARKAGLRSRALARHLAQ